MIDDNLFTYLLIIFLKKTHIPFDYCYKQ